MFWGVSAFNVSRGTTRNFNFQSDDYANLNTNYSTNSGLYAIQMAHFFIATRKCNQSDPEVWFQILNSGVSCVINCDNTTV